MSTVKTTTWKYGQRGIFPPLYDTETVVDDQPKRNGGGDSDMAGAVLILIVLAGIVIAVAWIAKQVVKLIELGIGYIREQGRKAKAVPPAAPYSIEQAVANVRAASSKRPTA